MAPQRDVIPWTSLLTVTAWMLIFRPSALLLHRFGKIEHQHGKKRSSSFTVCKLAKQLFLPFPREGSRSDGKAQWIRSGSQMLLLNSINKGQNKVAILLLEVPLVWPFPQGKHHKKGDAPPLQAQQTLMLTLSLPFPTFKIIYSSYEPPLTVGTTSEAFLSKEGYQSRPALYLKEVI